MKNSIIKTIGRAVGTLLFWLLLWQIAALIVRSEVLLPAPLTAAKRLLVLGKTGAFWLAVIWSLLRILLGFLLGVVAGCLLAAVCRLRLPETLLAPIRVIIKATPVASFIMLAWVWLNRDAIPVFIAALLVAPIVWGNVTEGIKSTDHALWEMTEVYGIRGGKRFRYLYLPSVLPYFTSAVYTCAGLVWKAGIAAEVLCLPKKAIGTYLYQAKLVLDTPDVFAWTAVVILISVALEKMIRVLLKNTEARLKRRGVT